MAAAGCVRSEDQLLCSICLDFFTDPVTTPCGHNFCKSCICEHWRVNVPYQCPMCKKVFNRRPELYVNAFIPEMVAQFRHEEEKANVKRKEAEIEEMILERRLKILEIQCSVELSTNAADRKAAEGVKVYTALIKTVQTSLNQFIEEIQEKKRSAKKQAEDVIKELEQEICELEKRSTELKQLSGSEDHHFGTVERAVHQLEDKLRKDMKKVFEAELKRVQQYEVDLTLDPDTASPTLILSDDRKQVHDSDEWKKLPDNPQRFTDSLGILAKQSFSSGRFYFEVQVKGKTEWYLGVVTESSKRKGQITLRPQYGYWIICLTNGNEYEACAGPAVPLSVQSGPQKVGVFVDYEEGLVSFYDVDSSVLIYSFIGCCFNDKLLPFFDPSFNCGGTNSAPLIITPVRH
uniref:Uncharacterized protein n=1 Tax=Sphaeramia orbicularis TaxID=375764 RepID=A0A673B1K3_9TELE